MITHMNNNMHVVTLHTNASLMPQCTQCTQYWLLDWASSNYGKFRPCTKQPAV